MTLYVFTIHTTHELQSPAVAFIGLNPSTANATEDDPTIRRCIGFAKSWRYGELCMVNLFAFRATKPPDMIAAVDPIGPENDDELKLICEIINARGGKVIAAWGTQGGHLIRDQIVRQIADRAGPTYYLKQTKDGHPSHPLYLKKSLTPTRWLT